jgi:hypothetical protein
MSEVNPFEITSTPTVERANRLLSVKSNPGFIDILRISEQLVREAADASIDYPGWDAQQITVLKCRAQAAKEHHTQLIRRIMAAIQDGLEAAKTDLSSMPAKTANEVIEQGDLTRLETLRKFDELDSRVPGSF